MCREATIRFGDALSAAESEEFVGYRPSSAQRIRPKSFEVNLTEAIVAAQKERFDEKDVYSDEYGGTQMMGAALAKGMVMVLSIWDDSEANMNWLDACTVADYQTYNCSAHATFDDPSMWEEAYDLDGAGAWRGPADFIGDVATFRDHGATFKSLAIPEPWRSQEKFACDAVEGGSPAWDCANETYRVVVSDIKVKDISA